MPPAEQPCNALERWVGLDSVDEAEVAVCDDAAGEGDLEEREVIV